MKKILLLLTAFLSLYSGAMAQTLIAHYDFNGNTTESVNSINASAVGTFSPSYVTGSPATGSQAIHLTNGDYLQTNYSALLNNASWTMTAIVKWSGPASSTVTSIIAERYNGTTRYGSDYMSAEIYQTKLFGSAANNVAAFPTATAPIINTGQWYCLTITYDNTTGTLNTYAVGPGGTFSSTAAWATTYTATGTAKLYIGAGLNYGFIGDIDDIKIYSGVFSAAQAASACNGFTTSGNPWMTVGNNTSAGGGTGNVFGTTNNDDVVIKTNSLQRGMITRTGLFGLGTGTATPTATLHVNTNGNGIRFQGLPPYSVATHTQAIVVDASGNLALAPHTIDWALSGNSVTSNDYFGSTNAADVNIETSNTHMGRFTRGGDFDLGDPLTVIPPFSIVFPNSYINGSRYCAAFGTNSTIDASGSSLALGVNHTLTASSASAVIGAGHQLTGSTQSIAVGEGNKVNSSSNISAVGQGNDINSNSQNDHAVGLGNTLVGSNNSIATGTQNQLTAQEAALVAGAGNILTNPVGSSGPTNMALGFNNQLTFAERSGTIGNNNRFNNRNLSSFAIGNRNTMDVGSQESFAIGNDSKIDPTASQCFAFGNGVLSSGVNVHTYGHRLVNTANNSLAIGFNNTRTMTVTDAGVGIKVSSSTSYTPAHNLEVDAATSVPNTSNIAFLNLPPAPTCPGGTTCWPSILVDPSSGELFLSNQLFQKSGSGNSGTSGNEVVSDHAVQSEPKPIVNAVELLTKISPNVHKANGDLYPELNLEHNKATYGLDGEDVKSVLPAMVKDQYVSGNETVHMVNYNEFVPLLIQAVKDQQAEIKAQQAKNDELKVKLDAYDHKFALLEKSIAQICESGCPGLNKNGNATDSSSNTDKLYQSIPNPTSDKAVINYFLSRNYEQARIVIADVEGHILQTINVSPKAGSGTTNVELSTFASQTYVYTLFVNEQRVDSKKMTVIK